MLAEVQKCAEKHDIKGLHYIFVDSLDVDPTFESYREDYEYCKTLAGMFDAHRDLTALVSDKNRWTLEYWDQLKIDLMKNFSKKRFEHMILVAKVIYAEKIARLAEERERRRIVEKQRELEEYNRKIEERQKAQRERIEVAKKAGAKQGEVTELRAQKGQIITAKNEDPELKEQERIAKKQRELEEHNRMIEEKQKSERRQIEIKQEKLKKQSRPEGDNELKKWLGTVLAIAIIAVAVVLIIKILH